MPTPFEPTRLDPVKFAYRVPNVSGGLVISRIEQRFGRDVIPLVREIEGAQPLSVAAE